eukprot:GHRQ01039009.1.p1 GENE.GHRQ01039009.1~~GHRQ01039009.1.p1  ORF type:complete len:158 (+),score=35.43 GHRQ01039009.1:845-1318(+)
MLLLLLQVFGLHANADISYYTSDTRALWGDLVDLQPRVGAASGALSREEFVAGIVRDISVKVPEQFDLPLLAKGLGVPRPTQVVLLQELARWNGVLETMNTSLQDLQRALSGGWDSQVLAPGKGAHMQEPGQCLPLYLCKCGCCNLTHTMHLKLLGS